MKDIELQEILTHWEINGTCKLLHGGSVNQNWKIVSSTGSFVLRQVTPWKNKNDIILEHEYLQSIRGIIGVNIAHPILSKEATPIIEYNNQYYWLYEFLPGNHRDYLDKYDLEQVGSLIGKYHTILIDMNFSGINRLDYLNRSSLQKELNDYRRHKDINKIFPNELKELDNLLEQLDGHKQLLLDQYPIHRDIRPDNLLWIEKRLCGILDFENVSDQSDILIKDLAVLISSSCWENGFIQEKITSIIDGYLQYRKISIDESNILPLIIIAGTVEDALYQIWLFSNRSNCDVNLMKSNIGEFVEIAKKAQNVNVIFRN